MWSGPPHPVGHLGQPQASTWGNLGFPNMQEQSDPALMRTPLPTLGPGGAFLLSNTTSLTPGPLCLPLLGHVLPFVGLLEAEPGEGEGEVGLTAGTTAGSWGGSQIGPGRRG